MISDQTVDEIFRVAFLEDLLNERVTFRSNAGGKKRCKCPVHGGDNPTAFCYDPSTDSAHCFTRGEHFHNAVDFLMKADGLSYVDALRTLAKRYNIEIVETYPSAEAQAEAARKKSHQALYTVASEWYQQQLFAGDTDGDKVLEYLHKRGLTDETIRTFQLGFSPRDSHALGQHLLAQGYSEEMLTASLLLFPGKDNTLYDKFHGRLVFTLQDSYGQCVGFSGRNLSKRTDGSKYENSRESALYQKRHTLYGYHIARAAIAKRRFCYLVEGFTDAMMMHQCGIPNVVASQGTAVTAEQARMIRKLCTRVVILLDGDEAGTLAAERAISPLLEAGCLCEVVSLPDGEDPCSYGLQYGAESLGAAVSCGVDFVRWLWDRVKDVASVEVRGLCVKKIAGLIGKVQDVVYRGEYLRVAKEVIGNEVEVIDGGGSKGGRDSRRVSGDGAGYRRGGARYGGFRHGGKNRYGRWKDETEWRAMRRLRLELGNGYNW